MDSGFSVPASSGSLVPFTSFAQMVGPSTKCCAGIGVPARQGVPTPERKKCKPCLQKAGQATTLPTRILRDRFAGSPYPPPTNTTRRESHPAIRLPMPFPAEHQELKRLTDGEVEGVVKESVLLVTYRGHPHGAISDAGWRVFHDALDRAYDACTDLLPNLINTTLDASGRIRITCGDPGAETWIREQVIWMASSKSALARGFDVYHLDETPPFRMHKLKLRVVGASCPSLKTLRFRLEQRNSGLSTNLWRFQGMPHKVQVDRSLDGYLFTVHMDELSYEFIQGRDWSLLYGVTPATFKELVHGRVYATGFGCSPNYLEQ